MGVATTYPDEKALPWVSSQPKFKFLSLPNTSLSCMVKGKRVNRGAGYGPGYGYGYGSASRIFCKNGTFCLKSHLSRASLNWDIR